MPGRAPPLPTVVVYALVGRAIFEGKLGLAAAVTLAFAVFLRTGEMLGAQFQHIAIVGAQGTIALPLTKSGRRKGHQEMVSFECLIAQKLLVAASVRKYGGDSVIEAPGSFRAWWRAAITDFGMDAAVFRPYGLRRGGATEFFRKTGSLEATLFRGRWSSMKTARAYIVEGMSLIAQNCIDLSGHKGASLYLRTLW